MNYIELRDVMDRIYSQLHGEVDDLKIMVENGELEGVETVITFATKSNKETGEKEIVEERSVMLF